MYTLGITYILAPYDNNLVPVHLTPTPFKPSCRPAPHLYTPSSISTHQQHQKCFLLAHVRPLIAKTRQSADLLFLCTRVLVVAFARVDIFMFLNGVRALSIIACILVFASSIVTLVHDVEAVNKFIVAGKVNATETGLLDCDYIACVLSPCLCTLYPPFLPFLPCFLLCHFFN